jgi:hypothetical protein
MATKLLTDLLRKFLLANNLPDLSEAAKSELEKNTADSLSEAQNESHYKVLSLLIVDSAPEGWDFAKIQSYWGDTLRFVTNHCHWKLMSQDQCNLIVREVADHVLRQKDVKYMKSMLETCPTRLGQSRRDQMLRFFNPQTIATSADTLQSLTMRANIKYIRNLLTPLSGVTDYVAFSAMTKEERLNVIDWTIEIGLRISEQGRTREEVHSKEECRASENLISLLVERLSDEEGVYLFREVIKWSNGFWTIIISKKFGPKLLDKDFQDAFHTIWQRGREVWMVESLERFSSKLLDGDYLNAFRTICQNDRKDWIVEFLEKFGLKIPEAECVSVFHATIKQGCQYWIAQLWNKCNHFLPREERFVIARTIIKQSNLNYRIEFFKRWGDSTLSDEEYMDTVRTIVEERNLPWTENVLKLPQRTVCSIIKQCDEFHGQIQHFPGFLDQFDSIRSPLFENYGIVLSQNELRRVIELLVGTFSINPSMPCGLLALIIL